MWQVCHVKWYWFLLQNEAEAEEKESRFLQEKQLQNLTDEDFLLDIYSGGTILPSKKKTKQKPDPKIEHDNVAMDFSKLSRREKVRLFERECPEFSSIVSDFDAKMKEVSDTCQPLIDLMNDGVLPNSGPAAEYTKLKYQLSLKWVNLFPWCSLFLSCFIAAILYEIWLLESSV